MWPKLLLQAYLFTFINIAACAKLNMLKFEENRGNTLFNQVLVDESTGNVFVGGRNGLYKFDRNLNKLQSQITGPSEDGIDCSPVKDENCDRKLVDNEVSILERYPNAPYLLFCGTLSQGLCSMYSTSDFTNFQELDPRNKLNLLGSRKSAVAFFAQAEKWNGQSETALYVASSYDGRPLEYSPRAVSARVVKTNTRGKFNTSYVFENPRSGVYSAIDIDPIYKSEYIVDYVYGFEHGGFSYFLTVQKENVQSQSMYNKYTTHLIRVCQNDPAFYSYTEITIMCRKQRRGRASVFYNKADAAYFGDVGEELRVKNNWPEGEKALFIAFGKSHNGTEESDPIEGSGICMYPMFDLNQDFKKAQQQCYRGDGHLLPWIINSLPPCQEDMSVWINIDDSFCGADTNVAIGGRYPLQGTAVTNNDFIATALGIDIYMNKTIAIVGTKDGHVMKILLDGSPQSMAPYAQINVGEGTSPPAVARDIAFDSTNEYMYVLTGKRVTKVPIQSCRVYNECSECVTTRHDPLNCGWCGNHCSTYEACLTAQWTQHSCPPTIEQFYPKSGPVQGGTRVTIVGQNFGTADVNAGGVKANVHVAFTECIIESRNSTVIICRTGETDLDKEWEVKVVVVDRTRSAVPFIIEGSVTTGRDTFSYQTSAMTSFSPSRGPKSGGTILTIKGTNLNIGSNRLVTLGHLPCEFKWMDPATIVCETTEWIPELDYMSSRFRRHRRSLMEETVNVTIDAASLFVKNQYFHYEEDPTVTNIHPQSSILSGGTDITVTGTNLHVVASPKIMGSVVGERSTYYEALCEANDNGSVMICESPNISQTTVTVTAERPLVVDIQFLMDAVRELRDFPVTHPVLSRFSYVIDPTFYKFSGANHVRTFYEDETHLDIKGENLDLISLKNDILVIVGGGFCNVTLIGTTVLLCAPDKPENLADAEPEQKVEIRLGNLKYNIGNLQYATREPNLVVAGLLGSGLGVICIILMCFCLMWMKKTHRGPFKKVHRHEPDVRYTAGNRVEFSSPYREQIYRLNTAENPYWSQTQVRRRQFPPPTVPTRTIIDEESRRLIDDANLLIDRDRLLLLEAIGQGHFGCVYRGFLKVEGQKAEIEVAVKTLKSLTDQIYTSSLDGRKFLEEALRMREFDHPQIVRLIGIALDKEDMPLVVLPFMKNGDLLSYIRDEKNTPTVKDLMEFGIQIAEGMAYLANLKFVHRDLAARNCMLDDHMNVKVADFGLSRDIYERDYYSSDDRKAKLPVKWMALESLEKGTYNIKTDVWSYGVVLWELMTRGVCPYPEVDNWDIIKYLKSGRRMPQPSYCPDALYRIMLHTWDGDPRLRPSFEDLVFGVRSIIISMERAHAQEQQVTVAASYINVPTTQNYLYPQTPPVLTDDPPFANLTAPFTPNTSLISAGSSLPHVHHAPVTYHTPLAAAPARVYNASKSTLV